ncbi:hypothetical protein JNB11_04975 [Kocuria palustris]|nr:hypothetical protein [Kocuria palustris]
MADDNPIPMWQKMISACLGLLVTLVVVTPFDVIRVRIQQQELLGPGPALVCKEPQGRPPPLAPFWATLNYCHACDCQRITSTWQGMKSIAQREGLPTLWRGLSLTLFMSIPSNIIYFTGYEFIRDHLPIYHHSLNPLVCGMLARTISATLVAPFELIKTRLQSVPSTGTSGGMLRKLWRQTQADVRTNGWRTLFTGLTITLWRDVPFLGIYWLGYERIKAYIRRHTDPLKNSHVFMNSFILGSLLGLVAAIMTHPFDVGKTRLQIEATHLGSAMFKFLWQIGRNEGIGALYAGLTPRVMKIAPACAIMISSYEIGKKFFMTH